MGDPDEWVDQFRDANGQLPAPAEPAKLVIAHLHPGEVSASFQHSLQNSVLWDLQNQRRLFADTGQFGFIACMSGAGRLERGRNNAVTMFLDQHTQADLLMFIDSDMGWNPDSPFRLADIVQSDPERFPIVAGLCFGSKPVGLGDAQAMRTHFYPTLYRWSVNPTDGAPGWDTAYDYPKDALVEVGATGAAFLCIHRSVLEKVREAEGDHWFDPMTLTYGDSERVTFGEDMSFAMRMRSHGFPEHVHTGIGTSHMKTVWVDQDFYELQRRPASDGVTVVVPVKDRLDLTRNLVAQLVANGGYDDLLIMDNGSGPEMREWLDGADQFDTIDCADVSGISEMWNRGIDIAQERHRGRADVVLLNNDLDLCDRFVERLVRGLHSDPQVVCVGGNYDNRAGTGVELVRGIAANRYDGSGGLPGFAMALRADWLEEYRFPESLRWWYSDNSLCMSMDKAGAGYGIVIDATVEHLGGGSQTTTPDGWDDIIAADRDEFLRLWPGVSLTSAAAGADASAGVS